MLAPDTHGNPLIGPVQIPVIPGANALNHLVFAARERRKIGLKSPISLFFSLLPGTAYLETSFAGLRTPPAF